MSTLAATTQRLARAGFGAIPLVVGSLPVLSGRSTGPTGVKGIFFRLVRTAMSAGTTEDFLRMLEAGQPQVRVLGLTCLCLRQPPGLEEMVAPLLDDPATVKVCPFGCIVTEQTVGELAHRLLRNPTYFGHRSLLQT